MIIRSMKPEDYGAVDRLMGQLNQLHTENRSDLFTDIAHPYSEEEYLEKLSSPDCVSILAEEQGEILGLCFVSLCPKYSITKKRLAYMDDLFVVEAARRKGAATQLFQAAARHAKALGAEHLTLRVWAFNASALAFYQSLGMTTQSYVLETPL